MARQRAEHPTPCANLDRRRLLLQGSGCAAWLAGLALAPAPLRAAFAARPQGRIVEATPFARVERIADGVWAIVSTPLRDGGRHFTTTANGGIVAGRDGVVLIEAFYSAEGARWAVDLCRRLTGRAPDRIVVTHYHADHSLGLATLAEEGADATLLTQTTRGLLEPEQPMPALHPLDESEPTRLDLGGRTLLLSPRGGHTASDVTIELEEPGVIWCGDLVWNGMFPNFVDAIPSALLRHCESLLGRAGTHYVPGHGDAGDAEALAPYLGLLQDLAAAAGRAREEGIGATEAAARYRLPAALSDWVMFSPDYFERAFRAFERERAMDADRGVLAGPV